MKTNAEKYKKEKWDIDTWSELTAHEVRQLAKEISSTAEIDVTIHIKDKEKKAQKKIKWI